MRDIRSLFGLAAVWFAGIALMTARGTNVPESITINRSTTEIDGIFYAPRSRVEFNGGTFNGVCRYVCFVADTLKLENASVNVGAHMEGGNGPFGQRQTPANPPALMETFRPYIVSETVSPKRN